MIIRRAKFADDLRTKAFDAIVPLDKNFEVKSTVVEQNNVVVDYQDVSFSAYASTWGIDRDGEQVRPGAFKDSILDFMKNPIALKDHRQSVDCIVGQYESLMEDRSGLFVKCRLSNAPDVKSIRFKVVEKCLRALSIAGLMFLEEDRTTISQVRLWEISLVAVPANPDALIDTVVKMRDLTDEDRKNFDLETAGVRKDRESRVKARTTRIGKIVIRKD